ncbi:MAG: YcbK family protein [Aquificaceae bacterium]|nr:YcbK family protein [Aquificaceae bacterium]
MTRRDLIKSLGFIGFTLMGSSLSFGSLLNSISFREGARSLNLYALNTGESIKTVYWIDGVYIQGALKEIDYLLRDHRSGQVTQIDTNLLDLLYLITSLSEKERIVVISGYRAPSTNEYLRKRKRGIARESYHTLGKAVDIRIEGMPLTALRDLAIGLRAGGVGYYPKSGFVHLDTGTFRYW